MFCALSSEADDASTLIWCIDISGPLKHSWSSMPIVLTFGTKSTGGQITIHPDSQNRTAWVGGGHLIYAEGSSVELQMGMPLTRCAQPGITLWFPTGARRSYQQLNIFASLIFFFPYRDQCSFYLPLGGKMSMPLENNTRGNLSEQKLPARKRHHQVCQCETWGS